MAESTEVEIVISDAIDEFDKYASELEENLTYYNADRRDFAIGISTPVKLRKLEALVEIPKVYINALAERLHIEGFRIGGQTEADEELWQWFRSNSLDTASNLAHTEAMIHGRSYITVAAPAESDKENPMLIPDMPIIRVESPGTMYAEIDPRTQEVAWAVRVIKREGETIAATLYTPTQTEIYSTEGGSELVAVETITHNLGVVPVVPILRQQTLTDTAGASMITAGIRSITDATSRLLMDMQTTSALMANPQRVVFGTDEDELMENARNALYTASYMFFENEQGKIDQLPAAELRNYTDGLTFLMKMAASYTGLPPQYLSFSDDNPASAEAIRSAETRMVQTCENLCSMFGDAWEKTMRIALLIMGKPLSPEHFRMETIWRNPATTTYQSVMDAAIKGWNGGNSLVPREQLWIDCGYTPEERRQMRQWLEEERAEIGAMLYEGGGDDESDTGGEPDQTADPSGV